MFCHDDLRQFSFRYEPSRLAVMMTFSPLQLRLRILARTSDLDFMSIVKWRTCDLQIWIASPCFDG